MDNKRKLLEYVDELADAKQILDWHTNDLDMANRVLEACLADVKKLEDTVARDRKILDATTAKVSKYGERYLLIKRRKYVAQQE